METSLYILGFLFLLLSFFRLAFLQLNTLDWREIASKNPKRYAILSRLHFTMAPLHIVMGFLEILLLVALLYQGTRMSLEWKYYGLGVAGYAMYLFILTFIITEERAKKIAAVGFPIFALFLYLFLWRSYTVNEGEIEDEEISAYIDLGKDEGIVEPQMEEMLESVVEFQETCVREVMTPRLDIVVAKEDDSLEEIGKKFMEHSISRLPIVKEGLDSIIGILHIKDFFKTFYDTSKDWKTYLRKPLYVPESMAIHDVLAKMKEERQHLAIVVDEYGGTAGLVTMEDLLEEIVGEITDEHERDEVEKISEDAYSVDGKVHVDILEQLFGVSVEDTEFDTIGGLVVTLAGKVPNIGETYTYSDLTFRVEASDARRVKRVRVSRA